MNAFDLILGIVTFVLTLVLPSFFGLLGALSFYGFLRVRKKPVRGLLLIVFGASTFLAAVCLQLSFFVSV